MLTAKLIHLLGVFRFQSQCDTDIKCGKRLVYIYNIWHNLWGDAHLIQPAFLVEFEIIYPMHPSKYLIARFVVIMKREEFLANFTQDTVCIIDVLDAAYLRQICLTQIEI